MNLKAIYHEVETRLQKIDFTQLYPTFRRYRFALYNESEVCLDGELIKKTPAFLANTAIEYDNEWIAIWQLTQHMDYDVLASKLAHEMFHAHQMNLQDNRFPNDVEALIRYDLNVDNLSRKQKENEWLTILHQDFSMDLYQQFLSVRKQRSIDYPYEFQYEASVEEIEGTANYIELQVLKQLSKDAYDNTVSQMRQRITTANSLIPVRIVSYDIGALLLDVVQSNLEDLNLSFDAIPFPIKLMDNHKPSKMVIPMNQEVQSMISRYQKDTQDIIQSALDANHLVAEGAFTLLGVNVYNARYQHPYLVSTFFVMYLDQGEQVLKQGNFVLELENETTIKRVYQYA